MLMSDTGVAELARKIKAKMDADHISREALVELLAERGTSLSTKTISNIRNQKHLNADTVQAVANALGLTDDETSAEPEEPALERRVSEGERQFLEAIAEFGRAERVLDALMSELARFYAEEQRAEKQGARATAREVAEMQAYMALNDSREWTRYEMALIEEFFPDYPQDVRDGSSFADLTAFKQRVARLQGPPTTIEVIEDRRRAADRRPALYSFDEPEAARDEDAESAKLGDD